MIAVIADDFTGAAELAGIALQYNLSVMLCTHDLIAQDVDVLIVSTDSRSLNKTDALNVTKKSVQDLQKFQPTYIYKKVDSVLRGYVLDELKIQMDGLGLKKALLLPANPSLKRTIKNKKYYINNTQISETNFANDPEFAIKDSSINSMLKANENAKLSVLNLEDELPLKGVIVGEVSSEKDIDNWINKVNTDFLFAGAGDFFERLLQQSFTKKQEETHVNFSSPCLYVSGTSFRNSVESINNANEVHYLSTAFMQAGQDEDWLNLVSTSIKRKKKAIIAIDEKLRSTVDISALALRITMAKAVAEIINKENISEVFIEGGSTAAAILQELALHTFIPTHQIQRGVIRMKALQKELYIIVKPGSYELPKQISELFLK